MGAVQYIHTYGWPRVLGGTRSDVGSEDGEELQTRLIDDTHLDPLDEGDASAPNAFLCTIEDQKCNQRNL